MVNFERPSIAYAVAGKRQRNIFLEFMNNWNESLYLSAVALNSEGTALKKQEIYVESYEAKVNKLKSTWDEYTTSISNSGWLKDIIDAGTNILSFLDKANVGVTTVTALALLWKREKVANLFGTIGNLGSKIFLPTRSRQLTYMKSNRALEEGYKFRDQTFDIEQGFVKKGLNK